MRRSFLFLFLTLVCVTGWGQSRKKEAKTASKPFVLGVIDEIPSQILDEKRILNIYLPEGYNPKDTVRYPVIYLLDGGADEDFIHVVGLVQFNNFPWIERVPKSIVVGIANKDRRKDFTYPTTLPADQKRYPTAGKSENFISFLEKELQPYIEKNYPTNPSKTLIGQSLGGLLATEILFKKPTLFNKYIIISPSIWWDNGSILTQAPAILEKSFTPKTEVYLGVGKEGLTPGDIPRVMEVDVNLLVEKLRKTDNKNLSVYFDYLPDEDHATITHQAVFNAFRALYPVPAKK
ncbi:alpha/beta hydrolase [Rufibacter glacialis]|uniref:Alpha/beta hydrolase n=1 Tax=Rufibacter glacialis TaxID=1259555 RepID=A0A5M8QEL4_9BACT|nr:alpha/beta hydrolase-fold protein [Rufibacter glacialis]KAA6434485.1 alpha/beta hydrolase [Rufibacter glacialis]GGK70040.1 esterase [Rufibacter glacialis]